MQQKKLWNELTDEELVNSIEDTNESNVVYSNNENEQLVLDFLSSVNIKSGDEPVIKKFLYKLFLRSTYENLSIRTFINICNVYLKHNDRFYFIDKTGMTLTKEAYDKLYTESIARPKIKRKTVYNKLNSFCNKYNVQPGKETIGVMHLYRLFENWCYKNKKHPTRFNQFSHRMKSRLDKVIINDKTYFLINMSKLLEATNEEEYKKAEAWAQKANERFTKNINIKNRQKKKQKKQQEVPSVGPSGESEDQN
jgi:hypothetical protein